MAKKSVPRPLVLSRREREAIARLALETRQQLLIQDQHAPNLLKVLEGMRAVFPYLKVRFVSDILLPNADAQALPKKQTIRIRASVRDGLKYNDERSRWTIAHELGHIFLKHPRSAYRLRDPSKVSQRDKLLELQANYFAAEFLAPRQLVRKYASVEEIKARFKISSEAASKRLADLEFDRLDATKQVEILKSALIRSQCVNSGVAPIVSNLESLAVSIVACGRLLLEFYDSVRKIDEPDTAHVATALAIALIVVQPLQPRSNDVALEGLAHEINKNCAIDTIAMTLAFELPRCSIERAKQVLNESEFPFLRPFVDNVRHFLRQRPNLSRLTIFPTYEDYGCDRDISWTEIGLFEKLLKSLSPDA